jgi:hypothetical protein
MPCTASGILADQNLRLWLRWRLVFFGVPIWPVVGLVQEIVQPRRQVDPVLCKLREMLELLVNLVLDFTEPSVPTFLMAVAFVIVYALQPLVEHP